LVIEIEAASPDIFKDASPFPFNETIINGLMRSELFGHGTPRRTRPENVEHAVKEGAIIGAFAPATIARWRRWRN
jgi:hypothetical protein